MMELLKQDFGVSVPGLDPLPEDHSGLDVPKIFQTFRQAVKNIETVDAPKHEQSSLFDDQSLGEPAPDC